MAGPGMAWLGGAGLGQAMSGTARIGLLHEKLQQAF
mgnify:CR=1 FL=1